MQGSVHHSLAQPRDGNGQKFVRRVTPTQERAIVAGVRAGRRTRDIARDLGLSHMTVSRYARRARAQERTAA